MKVEELRQRLSQALGVDDAVVDAMHRQVSERFNG